MIGGTTGLARRGPVRIEHALLAVAAVAWAVLLLPGAGHGALPAFGAWGVMVAAMMLPPTLPLVRTLTLLDEGRARLPTLGVGAVVGVWLLAGVVLVAMAAGLTALLPTTPRAREVALGGALLVAGGYQLSPLRSVCLRACRTPRWFVLRYWHGRSTGAETLRLAAAYGTACVGCCWALMAVCVVGGAAALPAMVAFTVLMAVERLTPRGRQVGRSAGRLLLAAGAAALLGVLPDPLAHLLLGSH